MFIASGLVKTDSLGKARATVERVRKAVGRTVSTGTGARLCFLENKVKCQENVCFGEPGPGASVEARQMPIPVSADAYTVADLAFMRFGIVQARRDWLEPDDVINTMKQPDPARVFGKRQG